MVMKMELKPWVISVLSTDYDLHNERTAIINQLHEKNIRVSAFELPDFPVEPQTHSHDSCLRALERIDMALLIINNRYGGIYFGDSTVSITEEEYLKVIDSDKPCFVFVSKETWNARYQYKKSFKAWKEDHPEEKDENVLKQSFDHKHNGKFENIEIKVIDFVERIQQAYVLHHSSNWIEQYENQTDLINRVEGKLKGLSRFLLEQIVKKQKGKLERRHTSTGFSLSLGDVFSRGYYLEPTFEVESGVLCNDGTTLDTKILNTLINDSSILVFGEAGYGKTTILAKSYFSHVNSFLADSTYKIPLYVGLKAKNSSYHFSFEKYIIDAFAEDLNKQYYPYFDSTDIQPYFYFDGFDEIAEKMTVEEIERISSSDVFSHPVLLTCRQQYALRYINTFNFADKFNVRVKIKTWNSEKANEYIDNFCRIKGKDEKFLTSVHDLLTENEDLSNMLNSPLLVTMLLWIIEQNRMSVPETISSRVDLFKACLTELAKRELSRLGQNEVDPSILICVWSYAAWIVYKNKYKKLQSKWSYLIPKLKEILPSVGLDFSISHFEALFDSSENIVFGTFHEQFLEYLVANTIYIGCTKKEYPYPDFLNYVMRPEINRYFRAIWRECSQEEKNTIISNIHEQYLVNLGKDDFESVSKRVHAIYHIGRLDSAHRETLINTAFKSETHISVMLSLYFGAIKIGRLEDEQKFYDLLKTDESYNEANRGYHIAYYADNIMEDQLPFKDYPNIKWVGTLKAFLRHFNSKDMEHYYLRRIDLLTMEHLIKARNNIDPLTDDVINKIENLVYNPIHSNVEFQNKIISEFMELKDLYERIKNKE